MRMGRRIQDGQRRGRMRKGGAINRLIVIRSTSASVWMKENLMVIFISGSAEINHQHEEPGK